MRGFFIALAVSGVVSTGATAQKWSPAEQEIIDRAKQCSDLWESQGWGKAWLTECAHPDFRYWSNESVAPEGRAWIEKLARPRSGKAFAEQRPVHVAVYGDMAYMFSHWIAVNENTSGVRTPVQRQTTDLFRREGGKWLFLAEYESPNLAVAPKPPS